jgi:glucosamine-6-phosphate deaminase
MRGTMVRECVVAGIRTVIGEPEELALVGRDRVLETIRVKPDATMLFPTGSSPEGIYGALVSAFRRRSPLAGPDPSWAGVRCFNMDEYWGMPPWHNQSYAFFMRERLYRWVDARPENLYYPDGLAPTPADACESYERQVAELGGFDHVLFGVGVDGHLGFNEAGLPRSRTQFIELARSSREANARHFGCFDDVPTHAITAGLDTMLEARAMTLIAMGSAKADAIRKALYGPIGVQCPASLLRETPERCLLLLDEAAAEGLEEAT